ncbi:alpha/beta fold hydrolase [Porticoccaceae bacterium]|nr:alpha/beta fold hydrolase [Porticoccaceae bacterium]
MAIAKIIAFGFILLMVGFWAHTPAIGEPHGLPPVIDTDFISLKKNLLAQPVKGLSAQVGKFTVDGLIQYALLLQPNSGIPVSGWPVIIFNHGFHPEPHNNGRRSIDGVSDRPGDYYRQIPQALARQGFLVVVPDYRGHNDSSGAEFTLQESSPRWYVRDVLGLIEALKSDTQANMDHFFMLGHSMGAEVTLYAAAALGDQLKGASIWSVYVPTMAKTTPQITTMEASSQFEQIYSPINIHHAKDDATTAFEGSLMVASQLKQLGKTHELYSYLSANHLFTGDNLQLAITRDISFFRRIMLALNGSLE